MSEFEKLMSGQSKRPEIQKKVNDTKVWWRNWWWVMAISFLLTIIPPHIGILAFLPALIWGWIKGSIEWMG